VRSPLISGPQPRACLFWAVAALMLTINYCILLRLYVHEIEEHTLEDRKWDEVVRENTKLNNAAYRLFIDNQMMAIEIIQHREKDFRYKHL